MIQLPWPPPELSPNGRCHFMKKHRIGKKYKEAAFYLTKAAGILIDHDGPIHLVITFHPPTIRRRDDDNQIAMMKWGRDGIALALGVDDNRFRPEYRFGDPCKGGAVTVEIKL